MKILYAGNVLLDREKGDIIHFRSLAQALARRGHDLTVVAMGTPADPVWQPFHVVTVPHATTPKVGLLHTDYRYYRTLVRLGQTGKFDVLYHRAVVLANRAAARLAIPAVTEVNGIQVEEIAAQGARHARLRLFTWREGQTLRGADRLICVTPGIVEVIGRRYGIPAGACDVIANGTDTMRFRPLPAQACRARLGLDAQALYLGFVGAFQPWIDFGTLLRAVRQLLDRGIVCRCVLVGDGPETSTIAGLVGALDLQSAVVLPGRVDHAEVPLWLGAMDICVAPFTELRNASIGLSPLKLYEYMSAGRPIVATAVAGVDETIAQAGAGITTPIGAVDALADALQALAADPGARTHMGERARQFVVAHHSWDQVAARTETILQSVVGAA